MEQTRAARRPRRTRTLRQPFLVMTMAELPVRMTCWNLSAGVHAAALVVLATVTHTYSHSGSCDAFPVAVGGARLDRNPVATIEALARDGCEEGHRWVINEPAPWWEPDGDAATVEREATCARCGDRDFVTRPNPCRAGHDMVWSYRWCPRCGSACGGYGTCRRNCGVSAVGCGHQCPGLPR
jgi:hypothetical protein